ncbi:hypothetical protein F4778DRAFT_784648 [Xylariomycetidae sp. FL2044]|nr:hypothetical protein F4778DRAFT_784648 [Xylariomycetidae sp. FL2044]
MSETDMRRTLEAIIATCEPHELILLMENLATHLRELLLSDGDANVSPLWLQVQVLKRAFLATFPDAIRWDADIPPRIRQANENVIRRGEVIEDRFHYDYDDDDYYDYYCCYNYYNYHYDYNDDYAPLNTDISHGETVTQLGTIATMAHGEDVAMMAA